MKENKFGIYFVIKGMSWFSQDIAAEQSTMAYRAPELFDVKTGQTLDEKVDIWVCPIPFSILD